VSLRGQNIPNQPTPARAALALAAPHRHAALHWLISLGWIGLSGVSLIDASPIPLPIPGTTDLILLVLVARKGSLWLLVPLAVVGSVIGAYITWTTGKKGGEAALRRYVPRRYYDRITRWTKSHGAIAVALAAFLPPPVPLMPFLLAAGALAVPRGRFLVSFTAARTARYGIVAWLAVIYGRQMVRWWNRYLGQYAGVIGWVILALFVAAFSWVIWKWKHNSAQPSAQNVAEART
jgi:membrane protein DedA with SNARE-associated domain